MSADNRQLFSVLVMKFLIYATVKLLTHQSHYVSQIPVNKSENVCFRLQNFLRVMSICRILLLFAVSAYFCWLFLALRREFNGSPM